jgi:hypothetical protein
VTVEPDVPVFAPNDLDAEGAVLGGLLSGEVRASELPAGLKPEHFYSDANRIVFKAVRYLDRQGEPWDLVVLASLLREKRVFARVGGSAYLATLAMAQPSVIRETVCRHANRIIYLWGWRLCKSALELAAAEIRTSPPNAVLAKLQEGLDAIGYRMRSKASGMPVCNGPHVRDELVRQDGARVPRVLPTAHGEPRKESEAQAATEQAPSGPKPDPRRRPQSSKRMQGVNAATRGGAHGPIP